MFAPLLAWRAARQLGAWVALGQLTLIARGALAQQCERTSDLFRLQHEIDDLGRHRGARHSITLGGGRRLAERNTAGSSDRTQAYDSVVPIAREYDPDRALALRRRERLHEAVNQRGWHVGSATRSKPDRPLRERRTVCGGHYIDLIRQEQASLFGLVHGHRRGACEQDRQETRALRIEMLQNHEGEARIRG